MGQVNTLPEVGMLGQFPQDAQKEFRLSGINRFVVPEGGKYFFSPSLKAMTGLLSEVKATDGSNGHNGLRI